MTLKNLRRPNEMLFIVIILVGFWLRMHNLTAESIWFDEGYTLRLSDFNSAEILSALIVDSHPPVHFLLVRGWVQLVSNNAFTLRWLSVAASILTIPLVFQVGQLVSNRRGSLFAAIVCSVAPFHLYYAQEARMYALMVLLVVASMFTFIKLLRKFSVALAVGYCLLNILLLYTHLYSAFYILAQGLIVLFYLYQSPANRWIDLGRWSLIGVVFVITYIPWLLVAIPQVQRVNQAYWIQRPRVIDVVRMFGRFAGSVPLFAIAIVLFMLGIFSLWQLRSTNARSTLLLLAWLIIPIGIPLIISLISAPILVTRYTLAASVAFYLIMAVGFSKIPFRLQPVLGTVWIGLALYSCSQYFDTVNKAPWQPVVESVSNRARPDDLIVLNSEFEQRIFRLYRTDPLLETVEYPQDSCCLSDTNIAGLIELIQPYERVWLIRDKADDFAALENAVRSTHNFLQYDNYPAKYDNGIVLIELEQK